MSQTGFYWADARKQTQSLSQREVVIVVEENAHYKPDAWNRSSRRRVSK